ncbi:MAG: hypothetical protein P8K78_03665 [Pirellulales bacterium]|nr:hypothetical protein [Pirellulales bacterium]
MAGPWFTVISNNADWQPLGTLWVSDGGHDGPGQIEIKLQLVENEDANEKTNPAQLVDSPLYDRRD